MIAWICLWRKHDSPVMFKNQQNVNMKKALSGTICFKLSMTSWNILIVTDTLWRLGLNVCLILLFMVMEDKRSIIQKWIKYHQPINGDKIFGVSSC